MEIMSNLHKFEFYAYGGRAKAGNILIYLEMVVKINELSQSTIWIMILFFFFAFIHANPFYRFKIHPKNIYCAYK